MNPPPEGKSESLLIIYDASFHGRDDEENRDGEGRGDDDRGIKEVGPIVEGRLDDDRAEPFIRAYPLADDGADHAGRGGDTQRSEQEGKRARRTELPENL